MNIFATSLCPTSSAIVLPDRHIVKMPLESCQMLAVVASKWYHNYGAIHRACGSEYLTKHGAFRNHPCTKWVSRSIHNAYWLINHGIALCNEFEFRYNKKHACYKTLIEAKSLFPQGEIGLITEFERAMPDEYKLNTNINVYDAYKLYLKSKSWISSNYLRCPDRKPDWI